MPNESQAVSIYYQAQERLGLGEGVGCEEATRSGDLSGGRRQRVIDVIERRRQENPLLRLVKGTNLTWMKGSDERHWGCSGYGEWSQILEGPEHRAEKFYVRQGDRMLLRPGTGSTPLRRASFPDERNPIFHRMLGTEALCSAHSLKASFLPRKPGRSR